MIKITMQEYEENNLAVQTVVVTLFYIPILKIKKTSTNNVAVEQLTPIKKAVKIKGFCS